MRVLAHHVGFEPDLHEQVGHFFVDLIALRHTVDQQRLSDGPADRATRIEAGKRVLEDDLHLATVLAQRPVAKRGDVDTVEHDVATGRIWSRIIVWASVDLPHPLSPTTASVSPRPTSERHTLDGVHRGTSTNRKLLAEVPDLDERAHGWYSTRSNGAGSSRPAIDPSRGTEASSARV